MSLPTTKTREWHRDGFLLSTDPSLIDRKALNAAFDEDYMPWATPLSGEELKVMVENSVCFGLYSATFEPADTLSPTTSLSGADTQETAQPEDLEDSRPGQIGMARLITDYATVAYLTDVYILPEYQGRGLGKWLIACVKEWWESMPNGRRLIFIASEGQGEDFYGKALGSKRLEDENSKDAGKKYRLFSAKGRGARV